MNWMKYRSIYFVISAFVIGAGIFGLFKWGLKLGIDFTGGTITEYKREKSIDKNGLTESIKKEGVEVSSIQETANTYLFRLSPVSQESKEKVEKAIADATGGSQLRFETVGPVVGPELIKKTAYAILIASVLILIWVAYQFKSIKFGASAILAMFHDSLVLLGMFALVGHFFGAEVDFLFVTAMLTILSFSVHDTIVVFDRLREQRRRIGEDTSLTELADKAISETMVRSLNNSFTIIFMLVALVLLGGDTVRWFAVALLIGTISGTYSSPFVAIPLLVTWDEIQEKLKKR